MWGLFASMLIGTAMAATIDRPLDVQVQGQPVHALAVGYSVTFDQADGQHVKTYEVRDNTPLEIQDGKYWVNSVTLDQPVTFTFKDGNTISLRGDLNVHENGTIALAAVNEGKLVHWKMKDGRVLLLNCGAKYRTDGLHARVVTFYQNGQIASGCSNVTTTTVTAVSGDQVQLDAQSGLLDFADDGGLEYVESGNIANFSVLGQRIVLAKGREIHFHKNRLPHFFTMEQGQRLIVASPNGDLQITNPPGALASLILSEDQKFEAGYLAQRLTIAGLQAGPGRVALDPATNSISKIEIPNQVLEVGGQSYAIADHVELFETSGALKVVFLSSRQTLEIGGTTYLIQGPVGFDEQQNVRVVQLASDSSMVVEGKTIALYVGDSLIFSPIGQIVGLRGGPGHEEAASETASAF